MFEELFNYPAVLIRHLKAPLVSERRNYLAYRARDGTSRETLLRIARELLVIVGEMDLNSQVSISVNTIESAAWRWARRQKRRNSVFSARLLAIGFSSLVAWRNLKQRQQLTQR
jgi:hypothetical protein